MKKTLILLFSILSLASATAQDTLFSNVPKANYLATYDWWGQYEEIYGGTGGQGNGGGDIARMFHVNDTTLVYGIAASLVPDRWPFFHGYGHGVILPLDTTYALCSESLRLYEYTGNDLHQLGEDLPVNIVDTPVSYYQQMSEYSLNLHCVMPAFPVYERYFSQPQVVVDTFYAGVTQNTGLTDPVTHRPFTEQVAPLSLQPDLDKYVLWVSVADQVRRRLPDSSIIFVWHFSTVPGLGDWFLFPILTPPDTTTNPSDTSVVYPIDTVINIGDTIRVLPGDTLIVGGDTLVNTGDTLIVTPGEPIIIEGDTIVVNPGDTVIVNPGNPLAVIRQDDLIYRHTALQPNPATGRVRVLSSFGISAIEAYDLKGRLIGTFTNLDTPAYSLDVSSWPRGTYLLRILTPLGPTTKKLLLQ